VASLGLPWWMVSLMLLWLPLVMLLALVLVLVLPLVLRLVLVLPPCEPSAPRWQVGKAGSR